MNLPGLGRGPKLFVASGQPYHQVYIRHVYTNISMNLPGLGRGPKLFAGLRPTISPSVH